MDAFKMKKKIGLVFNIAPVYRKAIYTQIDNSWNCRWVFGDQNLSIKEFDKQILQKVSLLPVHNRKNIWYFKHFNRWLKSNNDLSHIIVIGDAHCLSVWGLLLKRMFKRQKIKVTLWTHGWYGRENKLERILKRFLFKMTDSILLYGDYAKQLMIKEGVTPDKLFVVHNSLDYNAQLKLRRDLKLSDLYKAHFQNNQKNIVFIGRLEYSKRLDLLLDAMSILKCRGELYNLTLIGDGSERSALESKAVNLGIDSQIWFFGASYDEKTNGELLFNADVCVSPGNIGLTAIHSLMFGTPCITHNNFPYQGPEFESIKEGKTGAFFKYNDASSLADSISKSMNGNHNRQQIREFCYNEIDANWTPDFQLKVIQKVISS